MEPIVSIVSSRATRSLQLTYADGSAASVPWRALRAACRCAECGAARLRGNPPVATADAALTRIVALGNGDLNLHFSDGHARGIYPLAYLNELTELTELGEHARMT